MPRHLPLPALVCLLALALASAAAADFRLERQLALEPGGRLVVDVDSGAVVVRGIDRSGARVVVTSENDEIEKRFEFSFVEERGEVRVRAERRGSGSSRWFGWGDGASPEFEIEVPAETAVRIDTAGGSIDVASLHGEARLDTSGGWIKVADLDGQLRADTSGGSITALRIGGDASLETSGGSIRAEEVAGDLDASTSGGSVDLREIGGRVTAETSGGSVTAEFAAGNGAGGVLTSSGGSVTAYLDSSVALDIEARSSGGRVSTDLPVTTQGQVSKSRLEGSINGGGPKLTLRSSGGGVRIKSR